MRLFIRIIINALAIWVMTLVLPAIHVQQSVGGILIIAIIFGLVNALIRPIVKLISLPITCLTLGLFTLVINALMLGLTSWLSGGLMAIQGGLLEQFGWAFLGAIIISLISGLLSWFLPDGD